SLTSSAFLHLLGLLALVLLGVLASTSRHSTPLEVGRAMLADEPSGRGGVLNPGDAQAKGAIPEPGIPPASAPTSPPPTLSEPQKPSMPLPPIDPRATQPIEAEDIGKQASDVHSKVQNIIGQLRPAPDGPRRPPGEPTGTVGRQSRWTLVFN